MTFKDSHRAGREVPHPVLDSIPPANEVIEKDLLVVKGKGMARTKKKVGEMSENRESDQSTIKTYVTSLSVKHHDKSWSPLRHGHLG